MAGAKWLRGTGVVTGWEGDKTILVTREEGTQEEITAKG